MYQMTELTIEHTMVHGASLVRNELIAHIVLKNDYADEREFFAGLS